MSADGLRESREPITPCGLRASDSRSRWRGTQVLVVRASHAAVRRCEHLCAHEWFGVSRDAPPEPPEEAEPRMNVTVDALRDAGIARVEVRVVEGVPEDAIVAAAEGDQADLVVMGTHGQGGIGRAVLGSVADHVARHASRARCSWCAAPVMAQGKCSGDANDSSP